MCNQLIQLSPYIDMKAYVSSFNSHANTHHGSLIRIKLHIIFHRSLSPPCRSDLNKPWNDVMFTFSRHSLWDLTCFLGFASFSLLHGNEWKSLKKKKESVTYWFYFTPSKRLTSNTTHKMEYITIPNTAEVGRMKRAEDGKMLCWYVTWWKHL